MNDGDILVENGKTPYVSNQSQDNGYIGWSNLPPLNPSNVITLSDTWQSERTIFYQPTEFIGKSHLQVMKAYDTKFQKFELLFVISSFRKAILEMNYDYGTKFNRSKINTTKIQLPTKNGKIDFDFLESFIVELEAERLAKLKSYLLTTGLTDYTLTNEEQKVITDFKKLKWKNFNLEKLFGKSTRGKRLKSEDRISGNLPFVTAGEADEGVSAFIGNDVTIFSKNTITIDMFGSAKYRNYEYGGDDHVAVVHTESLPKPAVIFVTSAIHKSSYNGQFNYGRNFYAKDTDLLDISLPSNNGEPDFELMGIFISAIQKLIIKDVVLYVDRKIKDTKNVINKNA